MTDFAPTVVDVRPPAPPVAAPARTAGADTADLADLAPLGETATGMKDPYDSYLASLDSAESRRTMATCLDQIARLQLGRPLDDVSVTGRGQPWGALRYEHTVAIRALLIRQGWSASHVNKHLSALRRVLKEAWRLGLMSAEDYQRAADFANVKATREPAGEYLPEEVIGALLAVCDADLTLAGARDGAIIAVLDACGLRRAELVAAQYAHYQRATRMLRIIGKGNKQRTIPVNTFAARYLEAWLAARGNTPGPLFPRLERGGNKIRLYAGRPRQMTPAAVKDVLDKRAGQAGTGAVRPHDARRTFVSNMLRVTDAIQTARMAGHASVDTTMRYDLRPDEELRDSADRLRTPQVRPLRPAPTSPPQSPPA